MKEIIVSEGQSLLDIALWLLGGTEGLFVLADANGLAITSTLVAGQVLLVPEDAVVSADQVSYYQGKNIRVNTTNVVPAAVPVPTGLVDFLEDDFIDLDWL